MSGGLHVLVDQAAQDRFSADPLGAEVSCGDVGSVVFAVGDALGDALVRPGSVVVHLVLGQDCAQMRVADNQDPVQKLAAQGADEALAGRVHSGSLDGGAQDYGAGGLEDGIEESSEVRSAVADQESEVLEPLVETDGQVAGLLHGPLAGRVGGDAAKMHPAGVM